MIDRYQLRYFLAVVDAGNFSRAASQVNVTQPTLSVGIAKLEKSLGSRLFMRNSQRVELTDAGVRLLAHARSIETEFNSLEERVSASGAPIILRIGVLSTIPVELLEPVVLANAAAERPTSIELVEGTERDLLGRLGRRRIDIALSIVRSGEDRYLCEPLYQEGYSIAAPSHHRYADMEVVPGEALANDVMIIRRHCEALPETSRYFTERGVRPRFSFRTMNDDRTVAFVRAGLGITVMPDSYRAPGLVRPRLAGFDLRRDIGLMFADASLAARADVPALQALRAVRPSSARS
jgi:DNA-binding transcriptional LysR family regulator